MGAQATTMQLAHALVYATAEVRVHSETNCAYFTRVLREMQAKGWRVKPVRRSKIYKEVLKRQNEIKALMLKLEGCVKACYPETAADYALADHIYNDAARHEENMNRVGDQILRLIRDANAF